MANEPNDAPNGDSDNGAASAEAAKYRRKLRETEAALEAATAQLAAVQRADVERRVAERLEVPADLFNLGGAELSELVDENGHVNDEAVNAAVDKLLTDRPRLAKDDSANGWGDVTGRDSAETRPTMLDVLRSA